MHPETEKQDQADRREDFDKVFTTEALGTNPEPSIAHPREGPISTPQSFNQTETYFYLYKTCYQPVYSGSESDCDTLSLL